jgi:predicted glycogen debranching enzyme
MVHRSVDAERGEDPDSDLFSPGYFSIWLEGGQKAVLMARALSTRNEDHPVAVKEIDSATDTVASDATAGVLNRLVCTMDHFLANRDGMKTVIAGFPWFLDWGRDSLMFVRGLVAAGETTQARSVIRQFGRFESGGTLPNMIGEQGPANYDTSDAPLWLFVTCEDIVKKDGDQRFLNERCGNRSMRQVLEAIIQAFIRGTSNGIRMDPESGLIFSPAHFTWMDTNHPAGTPREGFPIEIQALWLAALGLMSRISDATEKQRWMDLGERVRSSISDLYLIREKGYLSDCLHAGPGEPAKDARVDDALRPNQLLAITLGAIQDFDICRGILTACQDLLVPGAMRSLADRLVQKPLEIIHQGKALNDPLQPYWGRYEGDEDTRRKPAYHNGTAWTWLLPVFCEAWALVYGEAARDTARSWLSSAFSQINKGCIGHVPEIVDGDFPHQQRGCDAQAWGLSELVRVWTYFH